MCRNIFRQLLHFSRQLEAKGYGVYTFEASDEKKFKMIPSLCLPNILRDKQTKNFDCTEIKSVLVYK